MLSEREKRLIELKGEYEFLKEEAQELLDKTDLDEFEKEWLRAIIENIRKLEAEYERLIKAI